MWAVQGVQLLAKLLWMPQLKVCIYRYKWTHVAAVRLHSLHSYRPIMGAGFNLESLVEPRVHDVTVIAACLSSRRGVQTLTSVFSLRRGDTASASSNATLWKRSARRHLAPVAQVKHRQRMVGGYPSLWQQGLHMLTVYVQCADWDWKAIYAHSLTSKREEEEEEAAAVMWDTVSLLLACQALNETWDTNITG